MNREQWRVFLWMRARMLVNRLRRAKIFGRLGLATLAVLAVLLMFASGLGTFLLAKEEMATAEPFSLLLSWGGLGLGFLFFWMIGVLTDLQRSDSLSLKQFLHLPIHLRGIFFANYLGSFVSLSVILFVPAMIGMCVAMGTRFPWAFLLGPCLILSYLAMITAVTYQFRGWMARLMADKRRGRAIAAGVTFLLVLLLQAPNLINMSLSSHRADVSMHRWELEDAARQPGPGQVKAQQELKALREQEQAREDQLAAYLRLGVMVVPLGWMAVGFEGVALGHWLASLLTILGMVALSLLSLRRSYRTTMAALLAGGTVIAAPKPSKATRRRERSRRKSKRLPLLERQPRWLTDEVAAVALANRQSLRRAPEAKLMLLSPLAMLFLLGFMLVSGSGGPMTQFAPLLLLLAPAMGLFGMQQVFQNQFGLDRAGFRAYVLSPIAREDLLLGKNLALVPSAISFTGVSLLLVALLVPMPVAYLIGAIPQALSAFCLYALYGNLASIIAPARLHAAGLKPAGAQWRFVMWNLMSFLVIPLIMAPLLLPWGAEVWLRPTLGQAAVWLYPLGQVLLAVVCLWLYRQVLRRQGLLLQWREREILETLTRS